MQNIKNFLWLLKIGALVNIYFLINTITLPLANTDIHILIPAQILFTTCAYRCLFPVRYTNNIVFHKSIFSSVFVTRFFATFSEIASIYLFAYLIRILNSEQVTMINAMSWMMVIQVVVSQCFVWGAIVTGKLILYVYEEIGWGIIFIINTIASLYLYVTLDNFSGRELLIYLNLIFGVLYLPWQIIHIRSLQLHAHKNGLQKKFDTIINGLKNSIHIKNPSTRLNDWGGMIGLIWATSYWATILPTWIYLIVIYS